MRLCSCGEPATNVKGPPRCAFCRERTREREREKGREYAAAHRSERTAYKRTWRPKNRDKIRVSNARAKLKEYHSLSAERYDALLAAQGGRCAICGTFGTETRRLDVDHDHNCCPGKKSCGACVRGLLCPNCNTALGHFRDREDLLMAAIRYVKGERIGGEV